jgi:hypothetical protein
MVQFELPGNILGVFHVCILNVRQFLLDIVASYKNAYRKLPWWSKIYMQLCNVDDAIILKNASKLQTF